MNLKLFKTSCLEKELDIIVQQYLIDGSSYYFNNFHDENEEFIFKKELSKTLDIHIRDIAIVGSAKLGFSIKPEQASSGLYLFKCFDYMYKQDNENEKSDIDIAIISSRLFDKQLLSLYKHTDCYRDVTGFNGNYGQYAKYIVKGWLRPDKVPRTYSISSTIEEFRGKYKKKYQRKINFGIYKSWDYFESYHMNNVQTLKVNLQYNT